MGPEPDPNDPTPGMQIWGWMAPVELRWLMAQAAQMSSVVEVGSLHGRSSFALGTACSGNVYCIDPWDDVHDLSFASFKGNVAGLANVVPVRGKSPDVLSTGALAPPTFKVDMTFIDGAHDYDSVVADITSWLPLTRKLICGHDYHAGPDAGFPDVAVAVDDVFGNGVLGKVGVGDGTSIWYVELDGYTVA